MREGARLREIVHEPLRLGSDPVREGPGPRARLRVPLLAARLPHRRLLRHAAKRARVSARVSARAGDASGGRKWGAQVGGRKGGAREAQGRRKGGAKGERRGGALDLPRAEDEVGRERGGAERLDDRGLGRGRGVCEVGDVNNSG
jgi:hypothetical protein